MAGGVSRSAVAKRCSVRGDGNICYWISVRVGHGAANRRADIKADIDTGDPLARTDGDRRRILLRSKVPGIIVERDRIAARRQSGQGVRPASVRRRVGRARAGCRVGRDRHVGKRVSARAGDDTRDSASDRQVRVDVDDSSVCPEVDRGCGVRIGRIVVVVGDIRRSAVSEAHGVGARREGRNSVVARVISCCEKLRTAAGVLGSNGDIRYVHAAARRLSRNGTSRVDDCIDVRSCGGDPGLNEICARLVRLVVVPLRHERRRTATELNCVRAGGKSTERIRAVGGCTRVGGIIAVAVVGDNDRVGNGRSVAVGDGAADSGKRAELDVDTGQRLLRGDGHDICVVKVRFSVVVLRDIIASAAEEVVALEFKTV